MATRDDLPALDDDDTLVLTTDTHTMWRRLSGRWVHQELPECDQCSLQAVVAVQERTASHDRTPWSHLT